jgi:hypothetical protein
MACSKMPEPLRLSADRSELLTIGLSRKRKRKRPICVHHSLRIAVLRPSVQSCNPSCAARCRLAESCCTKPVRRIGSETRREMVCSASLRLAEKAPRTKNRCGRVHVLLYSQLQFPQVVCRERKESSYVISVVAVRQAALLATQLLFTKCSAGSTAGSKTTLHILR